MENKEEEVENRIRITVSGKCWVPGWRDDMELKKISNKVRRQRTWEQVRMGNKKEVREGSLELSCGPGKDAQGLCVSGAGYGNHAKPRMQALSEALRTFLKRKVALCSRHFQRSRLTLVNALFSTLCLIQTPPL